MKLYRFVRRTMLFALLAAVVCAPSALNAANKSYSSEAAPEHESVGMFEAMKSGDIEVEFIGIDATKATVIFKNKSDKPLAIKLPDAFAGVPVLAQFGGGLGGFGGGGLGGLGGGGLGGFGGGGGNQGLGGGFGGGMGGMGGGMGGFGGGGFGGFMNVAPDKVGKIKVDCVCLDHGRPDPNPRIKYEIVPIESYVKDPQVVEVCKMLAREELDQNTAQAAAWHLRNDMSWEELAKKVRQRSSFTRTVKMWFSPHELVFAKRAVAEAARRAKDQPTETPDKESSLSQQQ